MHVDEETDINRVTEYFSYEHFYVLYCRFFELDADKDSKLTREDLLKYGEHALSDAIVDRYNSDPPQEKIILLHICCLLYECLIHIYSCKYPSIYIH